MYLNYLLYMHTTSDFDLNRETEVVVTNTTVMELEYVVEVDLEPYALYTVTVIAKTGGGRSEGSSANFTTEQGGLFIQYMYHVLRYL